MTLEEALRLYPPEGSPLVMMPDNPTQMHQASQIIADAFRRLWGEHLVVLRSVHAMRQSAIVGENFALVRSIDIDEASRLLQQLYAASSKG